MRRLKENISLCKECKASLPSSKFYPYCGMPHYKWMVNNP